MYQRSSKQEYYSDGSLKTDITVETKPILSKAKVELLAHLFVLAFVTTAIAVILFSIRLIIMVLFFW